MDRKKIDSDKIGVLIVEPRVMVRNGIRQMLDKQEEGRFFYGSAGSYRAAKQIMEEYEFPIVIFSIFQLEDKLELLAKGLMAVDPYASFVGLMDESKEEVVKKLRDWGFKGMFRSDTTGPELYFLILSIFEGKPYFGGVIANILLEESRMDYAMKTATPAPVTGRELEIFKCLKKGKTTKEISNELFISPRTVETHRKNLLKKAGARNVAELMIKLFGYQEKVRGGTRSN